jgi:hypothetical protein
MREIGQREQFRIKIQVGTIWPRHVRFAALVPHDLGEGHEPGTDLEPRTGGRMFKCAG